MLGGMLVVLVCALGGVLLVTAGDDRVDVVVAAADLERGRPVERSDLRVVRVQVGSGRGDGFADGSGGADRSGSVG